MLINYSDIPGFPNLFLDYIYEFDNVQKFYKKNFMDNNSYLQTFEQLKSYVRPHRNDVTNILTDQYLGYLPSKLTENNINALNDENTFAIVTGQQATLFGGPLYTFYKIITTIKLSNLLKERFSDYNFVPVFWMEVDDHDFKEIQSVNIIDQYNKVKSLIYDDGIEEEINRGSVGKLKFNANINYTIEDLEKSLRDNEFKDEIMNLINNCYYEGITIKEAFKKLLFHFFDEYGLVIFNPQDRRVKDILLPVFEKEIDNYAVHSNENVLRSAELEENYHAQVKVNPINLFYSDGGGRHLVEPVEGEFRFRGRRKRISKDEIKKLLYYDPAAFSPNVLLRPICQDYLFPTAVYVGGPAEVSYFAQVMPNYSFFDLVAPIVFPRASATILEKHIASSIKKYDLSFNEYFFNEKDLINNVLNKISEFDLEDLFAESEENIKKELLKLRESLIQIDEALSDASEKSLQKITQALEILKTKSEQFQARKHEDVVNRIKKVRSFIYPNNTMQERELNFIYFANKYGLDIIKWFFSELIINKPEHQVIEL